MLAKTLGDCINPVMKGKNIRGQLQVKMKNLLVRFFIIMLLLSVGHIVIEILNICYLPSNYWV